MSTTAESASSPAGKSGTLPVTVIEPQRGWIGLNLPELWAFRELFGFMVWRDIKVMYKQTLLGAAWAILVPFIQMIIFTLIFTRAAKLPTNGLPGPLYHFAGLLIWTYFQQSLTMSSQSMVSNSRMLTKIYFPRLIIPTSACVTPMINFLIAISILVIMIVIYHVQISWWILIFPGLLLIAFLTAMGMGLLLSALNVKYRDVKYAIPFIIQGWMFLTVILPFSAFKDKGALGYLYGLNPMGGVVEGFRWCVFNAFEPFGIYQTTIGADGLTEAVKVGAVDPPWLLIGLGIPVALGMLFVGLQYFRRMERQFADII